LKLLAAPLFGHDFGAPKSCCEVLGLESELQAVVIKRKQIGMIVPIKGWLRVHVPFIRDSALRRAVRFTPTRRFLEVAIE